MEIKSSVDGLNNRQEGTKERISTRKNGKLENFKSEQKTANRLKNKQGRGKSETWDEHTHTTIYKTDKQQRHTV